MKPEFIKDGDTIALAAPSCGAAYDPYATRVRESIKNLRSLGFKVLEGKNTWKDAGVVASASPKDRGEEFMEAWLGPAQLVLSVGGGEFMCDMLPFVDFEKISRSQPKWFMGFSDNTNLTFTLTTLCDIESIYGPCAGAFHTIPFERNVQDALEMVKGRRRFSGYPLWELQSLVTEENPLAPFNMTEKKVITPVSYRGAFSGTMLGGCLDCLVNLCGTRFDGVKEYLKKHGPIIWYLEACDLTPLSIRRALWELKEAGWFDTASGFLIGRPLCKDTVMAGIGKHQAVTDILGDTGLPILMDIDLGHLPPALPFRNGAKATVEFKENNIFIEYED